MTVPAPLWGFFFFFSSRRRHTRYWRDWSSDVCSSDLGAIVNISTMVASFGAPGMALYGSTKAALELLTKAWAAEYGPQGVRVNALAPGPTLTPGTEPMGDGVDKLPATLPLGRPAPAKELANPA